MQAFTHAYLQSPDFFVHVIIFYKLVWVSFTFTKVKLAKTFSSLAAYWYVLNIACPKQMPS